MKPTTWTLWTDLESTGASTDLDEIIEVAMILTKADDLVEVDRFHTLVRPTIDGLVRLVSNPFVLGMHTRNGLLQEVIALPELGEPGLGWLDSAILSWLESIPEMNLADDTIHLAGSGVAAFDRPLINRLLPELADTLHYAPIDVGVMKRCWTMWTGSDITGDNAAKNHRAMDDVAGHLREAREFQHRFRVVRDVLANSREAT
jgi:oligoribonuclease (3'-5' exoribonuclease)